MPICLEVSIHSSSSRNQPAAVKQSAGNEREGIEGIARAKGARMGAITSAVIAIAAVILGWITIEVACKPCLDKGRDAIDRALNPNYDPDSSLIAPTPAPTPTQPLLDPNPLPAPSAKAI